DITGLSKEEFEILATETAMSIIRTAQQREAKASSSAEKVLNESKKLASSTLEQAEAKAKSLLAQAESRGRKYIEAAESDASDILSKANSEAEELLSSKKREGGVITSTAKKEADRLILEASTEVSEYRNWLTGVISEAERLYRIQSQSLDSAENAISQSRQRLESAFNRLAELQKQVISAISADGTPSADTRVAARISAAKNGSQFLYSETSVLASRISRSASLLAVAVIALPSRFLLVRRSSASEFALERISDASLSAASIYLRPRDSAWARSDLAFASACSKVELASFLLSFKTLSALEFALASRC
ncbi:MAG: hypothetical protein EBX82_05965, partial [Actinobacteria bacterium]|nr:hypothetical protein [Actinomycetota bacterium]